MIKLKTGLAPLRTAAALILVVAAMPLASGSTATASQGGDENKVTLCHRTNSENNPYVEITIDKAGVFKTGHDGHDEGGVHKPGDKANGVRWGDIIPPFTYFESPQAEKDGLPSEYAGLNWSQGQVISENGCKTTPPPVDEPEQPFGEINRECVESGPTFKVFGTFDDGDALNVSWRLHFSNGDDPIGLSPSQDEQSVSHYDVEVSAPVGTKVTLESSTDGGATWKAEDSITVSECPPKESVTKGNFEVVCDADGAVVTIGPLSSNQQGVSWVLRVSGAEPVEQSVVEGQSIEVAAKAELALLSVKGDTKTPRHRATAPAACPEQGTVDKTSSPATGSTVAAGSTIDYTVTVTNTGTGTLTDKPVVDTLPTLVTVSGTPSHSGVVNGNGSAITWTVTLTPGESKTMTYKGLVSASAPAASVLLNTVRFLGIEDTTTHTVGSRGLAVTKSVSPTGTANFGDTLTYTLTVSATGTLPQTAVVVTDPIPAGTTYVAGSAACVGATCAPTLTGTLLSWPLGSMEPNTSRSVNFKVTINVPTAAVAATGVTIRNSGAVQSAEVPSTPSNEVVTPVPPAATPVTAVLGTKIGTDDSAGPDDSASSTPGVDDSDVLGTKTGSGDVLAATGAGLPLSVTLGLGGLLLLAGIALVSVGRPATGRTKD